MNWNQFITEISSNYIQEFLDWPEAHTRLLVFLLLHLTTGFEHSPAQVTRRIWKAEGKLRNELLMNRSSEKRKWKRVQKEIHSLWKLRLMMVWAFFPPRSEWLPHHSPCVLYSRHVSSPCTADLWTTQVWTAQVWIHLHLDFFFSVSTCYLIGGWLNSQMQNCGYWEESWILNLSICGAAKAGNAF